MKKKKSILDIHLERLISGSVVTLIFFIFIGAMALFLLGIYNLLIAGFGGWLIVFLILSYLVGYLYQANRGS